MKSINARLPQTRYKAAKEIRRVLKILLLLLLILSIELTGIYLVFRYSEIPLIANARSIYIETAMTTMNHQYLAKWLFSQDEIDEVNIRMLSYQQCENVVSHVILPDISESVTNNVYEETIRKNQIDCIDIVGAGYKGKLLIIHDPTRVRLTLSDKFGKLGERLGDIVKRENAIGGINASGFHDANGVGKGDTPTGMVINYGRIVFDPNIKYYNIIGFNYSSQLVIGTYMREEIDSLMLRDAIDFSPFLIINGEKQIKNGSTGGGGIQPRTAIGQTIDGKILMLVIDGRQIHSIGATLKQVQDILFDYGAFNAACCDGGSSASMWYNGEIQGKPSGPGGERYLPNAFIIK